MWKIISLNIVNFGPYRDQSLQLKDGSIFLVQGVNFDSVVRKEGVGTGGYSVSNGSGKSFFGEALYVCLTGTSFRKVNLNKLICDDFAEESAEIKLVLFNIKDEKTFEIKRTINPNGTKCELFLNEEAIKCANITAYNEKICEVLGIEREKLDYFFIQKDVFQPFLLAPDKYKKEFINSLSGANKIGEVNKLIQADVIEFEKKLNIVENNLFALGGKLEMVEKFLVTAEENFLKDKERKIVACDEELKTIHKKISKNKDDIYELKEKDFDFEIKVAVEQGVNLLEEEYDETILLQLKNQEIELTTKIVGIYRTVSNLKKQEGELKILLSDVLHCPKCNHYFSLRNENFQIDSAKIQLKEIQEEIEEDNLLLAKFEVEKKSLLLEIEREEKRKVEFDKNKQKNLLLKNQIEKNIEKIKGEKIRSESLIEIYTKEIETLKEKREDIKKLLEEIKISKYDESESKRELNELSKELRNKKKERVELEGDIATLKSWIQRFLQFQTYLSNRYLKEFENQTNFFLSKFSDDLKIVIDGFKILGDNKTIRDEINIQILKGGKIRHFYSFSNGERMRIIVANILALQRMINLGCESGGLDFILLDEIVESLDEWGMILLLKSLLELDTTIYMVTHNNFQIPFNNVLQIEKRDGISTLNYL